MVEQLVSVAIEADIVLSQVSYFGDGVMQSTTQYLPLVVASRAARTVAEGPQGFKRSTLGESGFFMLQKGKGGADDCGDVSGLHSFPPVSSRAAGAVV